MSNIYSYLTHKNESYRDFAKWATSQENPEKYKIIEGRIFSLPNENTYADEVYFEDPLLYSSTNPLFCRILLATNIEKLPYLPFCEYLTCFNFDCKDLNLLPKCKKITCRKIINTHKLPVFVKIKYARSSLDNIIIELEEEN